MSTALSILEQLVNENQFKYLIDSKDVEIFKHNDLKWYTELSNNVSLGIRKNIVTGIKEYFVTLNGAPNLEGVNEEEQMLLGDIGECIFHFSEDDLSTPLSEEAFFFVGGSSRYVENKTDDSSTVRDTIKKLMKRFYSYNESFINSCFDLFDGCNVTPVSSIFANHKSKTCGFCVHEDDTIELDISTVDGFRHNDVCKKILSLYNMSTETTENFIDSLNDIFYNKFIDIHYLLEQKSLGVPNTVRIRFSSRNDLEERKKIHSTFINILVSQKILDESQAKDLNNWENDLNRGIANIEITFEKNSKNINIHPIFEFGVFDENIESILTEVPTETINYDSIS